MKNGGCTAPAGLHTEALVVRDRDSLGSTRDQTHSPCIGMQSPNQSILKGISPEYSLEGLMLKLKLKLQYFGHLMQRIDSLEKTLMLEKI